MRVTHPAGVHLPQAAGQIITHHYTQANQSCTMSVTTPAAAAAAQFILGKVQLYKPSEPVGPQTDGSVPEDGSPRAEFHSFRQLLTRGVAVHQCAWPCEERRMVLSSQKMEKQKGIYAGSEFLSRCGSGREWPQPCVCTLSIRLKDQCEIYRGLNDLKLQASSAWLIKHVCTKSRDPEYVHVCVCVCVCVRVYLWNPQIHTIGTGRCFTAAQCHLASVVLWFTLLQHSEKVLVFME